MLERREDNVYVLCDSAYDAGFDNEFQFLVYDYQDGGYDGSGDAYCMDTKGQLWHTGLGHCSCYGPFDGGWTQVQLSDLKTDSVHDLGSSERLEDVVLQLIEMYK